MAISRDEAHVTCPRKSVLILYYGWGLIIYIGFQVERDKTEFLKKIGLTEKELDTLYEENTILKNQNLELEVITTQTIDTKL